MKIKKVEFAQVPDIELGDNPPVIEEKEYNTRIENLLSMAKSEGFTHLLVYGDREHYSNIHYLCGFDPRFEEALLILSLHDRPAILVGNEGSSYVDLSPVALKKILYQNFSLLGQPRNALLDIQKVLMNSGIKEKSKVGVIGWKYFDESKAGSAQRFLDVPYYIAKACIDLAGENNVRNATDLMLHPAYGLRIKLDWKELVFHERAGTKSSRGVYHAIKHLQEGVTEIEASRFLLIDGDPLAAHPNVNFGTEHVLSGLASPSYFKKLTTGEVISIALGYRHSMTARTGIFIKNRKEIPASQYGIMENFYIPYFKALVAWYETLEIGTTGGQVINELKGILDDLGKFGINLNPGHLIHTDEWTNSIFYENSSHPISTGMAIQCDIIAFPGEPYIGVHVEDGIIIADELTRKMISAHAPASWERITKRKKIIKDILGINIKEEVLPTSNIQAMLFPYMKNAKIVLTAGGG